MLAYLSAAAVLMLAGRSMAQVIVDSVTVPLTDSKSTQGERYVLNSHLEQLSITCRANSTSALTTASFTWRKASSWANSSISDSRTPIDTKIFSGNLSGQSVLTINWPVKSDLTAYVCTVNQNSSATGGFISLPLLTIYVNGINEYDSSHWPGENLAVYCLVDGYPTGDIKWTKTVDPTFSVINSNTIYMNDVSYDKDRGYVTCSSTNSQGTNTAIAFLRIKSPSSYLAPLVAVIVEIVIMLVVAVGYELWDKKRRHTSVADGMKSE